MIKKNVIEIGAPLEKATKALVLLHGRGASAQSILSLSEHFADKETYVAAPQAPNNSWYPHSFLEEEKLNEPWLTGSIEIVKQLVIDISSKVSRERLYIIGFSQGACLALEFSARFAANYGGIAAFTGGLIGKSINSKKYSGNFEGTKIFIGNSDKDPHVPLIRSEESKRILEALGAQVTLKVYPGMPHTINPDEIKTVQSLLF